MKCYMKPHTCTHNSLRRLGRSLARVDRIGSALSVAFLFLLTTATTSRADPASPPLEFSSQAPGLPGPYLYSSRTVVSLPSGTSYQVNVNGSGQNIAGDAANEPSMCIDPSNHNRIAIGWRQFDTTNSNFRQAGYAFSTNGGSGWTFVGVLETNVFRSDPVLATDAEGRFFYLSLSNPPPYQCDIWRSTNGGAAWQRLGPATGGDKSWMTIDTTSGPGHDNIYQAWDTISVTGTNDFSFSTDGGLTWTNPIPIPQTPIFGTLDVGPKGVVYLLAWDGAQFWLNRSTNAPNRAVPFAFDLTVPVDLGGNQLFSTGPNPGGLLGQAEVAVDRSTNSTRGNVYALCSTGGTSNLCDVMFARSTNGGATWSPPHRINDAGTNAWHWFGAIAVAPNGRVDVCWYDTRSNTNNTFSELYYSYSLDGGLTWAANRPVSPAFDHSLGYPQQEKIGDYLGLIALNEATCIAYSATFNGEEDIYFLRIPDLPIQVAIAKTGANVRLSWNAVVGNTYCLQYKASLTQPWPTGSNEICLTATNSQVTVTDAVVAGAAQRFYRVVTTAYGSSLPGIIQQPVSATNYVSLAATFFVLPSGEGPLYYQWKQNGMDIPGATQNPLVLRPLSMGEQGAYTLRITNAYGAITSAPAMLTVLPPPTNTPNISGLVLHLPFDNNLTDATGRGNNGTAIHQTATSSNLSSPTFVSGMLGQALHYTSAFGVYPCCSTNSTYYVTLGVRPDLQFSSNVNFSVAYWIRLPANFRGGDLPFFTDAVGSTHGAGFVFAPTYGSLGTTSLGSVDGGWALSLFNGTSTGSGLTVYGAAGSINDGNWHHLVHTFDRAGGTVTYLDGVAASYSVVGGTSVAAAGDVDVANPATIGQDPTGQYTETGSADIDDLGVWRRALTSLEAASIYMAAVSNSLSFTGAPPAILVNGLPATQAQPKVARAASTPVVAVDVSPR